MEPGTNFNFIEIDKSFSVNLLPDNTVRIGKNSITMNKSVIARFVTTRERRPSGNEAIRLAIGYDAANHALRVTEAADGFAFRIFESNGSAAVTIPRSLIRAGIVRGDYALVDGTTNVFRLVQ